ncbi:MAG: hypothetical protein ACRCZD_17455 [Phycicoccus sp.]
MTSSPPVRSPDAAALAERVRVSPRSRFEPDDVPPAWPPHSAPGPDATVVAALAARLCRAVVRHPPDIGPAAGHHCAGGTHSRAGDGRIVCWSAPTVHGERIAVDAECVDAAPPRALAWYWSRLLPGDALGGPADDSAAGPPASATSLAPGGSEGRSPGGFTSVWTATEVVAKLTDTPVLLLARRGPVTTDTLTLPGRRIVLRHEHRAGLQLCFGLAASG